ncbi:MAG: YbbR-like domain-containing protein [Bacteroidaceae bacterium]|nr:YbbR-like domain-containing protein [Bacteroidaceae bacterium]
MPRSRFKRALPLLWRRLWNRQSLTFLGFVALAASFWLAVTLNETYEVDINVPLELTDVPGNVVVTTELPKELRVTLRDKGVRLFPYVYGPKLKPVVVSFREHNTSSGRVRVLASELLGQVQQQASAPTQIVRIKPDTLEYYFNFGSSKRVPVKFDGTVDCEKGYFVVSTKIQPEFVTVYAPLAVLDTLRSVSIRPLHLSGVRDTVRRKVPVATMRGMKSVPANVDVTLLTDRFTEKTVSVPIRSINFPASRVLRTFPSSVDVTFKVGVNQYDRIDASNFVIALPYEQLHNLGTNKVALQLRSIPDGASNVRINPATAEFVIETVPDEDDTAATP